MASSSPPNPAISPKEQADPAPDSADEKTSAAQPAQEIQKKDAKKVKLRKRRPFGSIRCRSCNSYGVTSQCSCAPTARYSVMIQSKRVSAKKRKEIRRLSFATVKEAEHFRNLIAERSFRQPHGMLLSYFGFDPFRKNSLPRYESKERFHVPSFPGQVPDGNARGNAYRPLQGPSFPQKCPIDSNMQFQPQKRPIDSNMEFQPQKRPIDSIMEFQPPSQTLQGPLFPQKRPIDSNLEFQPPSQTLQGPSFPQKRPIDSNLEFQPQKRPIDSNLEFQPPSQALQGPSFPQKRPIDSNLEYQPPSQRKCMGLPRRRIAPKDPSARMHPGFGHWQQEVPRSARPMPQHYAMPFRALAVPTPIVGTRASKDMAAAPNVMGSPRATMDSPVTLGDWENRRQQMKQLMLNVVSNCLTQQRNRQAPR